MVCSAVAGAVMLVSGVVVAPNVGATTLRPHSESAFCKTLSTFPKVSTPSTSNWNNYRNWIKKYLPTYEKLASEAPNNSVKQVLNEIVTLLKATENAGSAQALGLYIVKNEQKWSSSWENFAKDFSAAIIGCG